MQTLKQTIKFGSSKEEINFFDTVRHDIGQYFKENNISKHANQEMIVKAILWIAGWVATWYSIILLKDHFFLAVLAGVVHMFMHVMIAFNITHDANHYAMFKSRQLNVVFGYLIELLGCSRKVWMMGHNEEHHSFINIHEHDNNIEGYKILRLCPKDEWLKHHRFQWLYAPLVYGLSTINYATFRDFKMIYRYWQTDKIKLNFLFVTEFLFFKILYYSYLILIPILVFGVSYKIILTYFFIGHFINGLFLALIFVTGHLTENTSYPVVQNQAISASWAVNVINTTGDYATKDKFLQWLVGGINLHVAHHLFPRICHVHYKDISPIIKKVTQDYGYVYREIPSLRAAFKSHFMLLKTLSSPDAR